MSNWLPSSCSRWTNLTLMLSLFICDESISDTHVQFWKKIFNFLFTFFFLWRKRFLVFKPIYQRSVSLIETYCVSSGRVSLLWSLYSFLYEDLNVKKLKSNTHVSNNFVGAVVTKGVLKGLSNLCVSKGNT